MQGWAFSHRIDLPFSFMNTPSEISESLSWNELREETQRTSEQFRERALHEIKLQAHHAGLQLTNRDILESGFLPANLPQELRSVIVQCRKVLDAFGALEKSFPEKEQEQH